MSSKDENKNVTVAECAIDLAKTFTLGTVTYVPFPTVIRVALKQGTDKVVGIKVADVPVPSFIDACMYKWGGVNDAAAGDRVKSGERKGMDRRPGDTEGYQMGRIKAIKKGDYRRGKGGGSKGIALSELLIEALQVVRAQVSQTPAWVRETAATVRTGKVTEANCFNAIAYLLACTLKGESKVKAATRDKVLKAITERAQANIDFRGTTMTVDDILGEEA